MGFSWLVHWSGFHPFLQWIVFCQNSPLWPFCLGWPHTAWLIASLSYTSPFMKRHSSMTGNAKLLCFKYMLGRGLSLLHHSLLQRHAATPRHFHSNPSLCPTSAEEAEVEQFYEDLQDLTPTRPTRTNIQKICPFYYRGLECKSRKSRKTWSNRQIWPWSTEWNRAKANRVLRREHPGHCKHPLPTTQEKTLQKDITRWSIPKSDWLYSLQPKMKKLYTVSKNT